MLKTSFFPIFGSVSPLLLLRVNLKFFSLLLPLPLLVIEAGAQEVIISEFMASNQSGLLDEDGDRSDWIEIYNTGGAPTSLLGWFLTDDAGNLTKWEFPGIIIPVETAILVYASGKDRSQIDSELHTNFKLSKGGGYLGLIQRDGKTISHAYDPEYPVQLSDVSYGISMNTERTVFVASDSLGKILLPEDNDMGSGWIFPGFNDASWQDVPFGIGYLRDSGDDNPDTIPDPVEEPLVLVDLTLPSDFLEPTSLNSPFGEGVDFAIDNNADTKYLNFDKLNTGFTVRLARGRKVVTGLRLTSANDAPDRDPTSFILSGSNNGATFREIARGAIPSFESRFETVDIDILNDLAYSSYRLIFPTLRDGVSAAAMQIAEVEFPGWVPEGELEFPDNPSIPGRVDLTQLEDVSGQDDMIDPTTVNSPVNEEVWRAIDNIPETKYLNFDGPGSGFTIKPTVGPSVIKGLRLTSANDAAGRDPASYLLEGSTDGNVFEIISQGDIPEFEDRFTDVEVAFNNNNAYEFYRLVFPTLRGGNNELMQIAEVEFLGTAGLPLARFEELIQTDMEASMFSQHASVFTRFSFNVGDGVDLEGLSLAIRYDDGFIAYINGVEVARANVPDSPGFDSVATSDRDSLDAAAEERFDLEPFRDLMNPGENVLAILALNDDPSSSDFLLSVQLESSVIRFAVSDAGYFEFPSPEKWNTNVQPGLVPAPLINVESGFKSASFEVEIQAELEGARIYYSTDGSEPDELSGQAYTHPIHVNKTTVLRAAAFRDGWRTSPVSTRTFLFVADVVRQYPTSELFSLFPDHWGGQPADYGLDSRVVGLNGSDDYGGRYTNSIQDDLLSLPVISLVMESDDLFGARGIYANPNAHGETWEKPVSIELIYPDDRDGFQEDAGIRIQGGAFRRFDLTLKKSFRLVFRDKYGAAKLNFPLFGPDAAGVFDNVVLRANGNDGWKYGGDRALYIRDAFAMETARAMGIASSHTTFVQLYLNGTYWGLYNMVERPDAAFSSSYHGGAKNSWDALNQDSVPDGTREAWDRMLSVLNEGIDQDEVYQKIQGKNPDGIRDSSIENLLDIENLIDYCIMNFYIGNQDWPGRNFWVGRDREGDDGFQFYPWDSETAMGLGSGLNANQTHVNSSVARPYGALRANADFRVWFGDRVQHHFFKGGALYVNPARPEWSRAEPENNHPAARFAALAEQIDRAMVGESARWGDQLNERPYTRDEHWRKERDNLLTNYYPNRSAIVLEQLRQAGLFPRVDAPGFNLPDGKVEQGSRLTMSSGGGTIYYTLDGTDPRTEISTMTNRSSVLIDENTQKRVIIPGVENGGNAFGQKWYSDISFVDADWMRGTGGIGYDTGTEYGNLIGMDVSETMLGQNGSAYIRMRFEAGSETVDGSNFMVLRMRHDDGFAAYLNGVQIASANAPEILEWNSFATGENDDSAAVQWLEFDVSAYLEHLRQGTNLLAIQGLNVSLSSSDFLNDVELIAGQRNIIGDQPTSNIYTSPITLQDLTTIKARTLSGSEWSALNEATFIVGQSRMKVSELHYHPVDPSEEEIAAKFLDADEFEFIELYNSGTGTMLLEGVRFVDGVDFDFTDSLITRLAPGGTVLVVKNLAAFVMRYGSGLPVAGEYAGNFSNSGESVELVGANDITLISFSYDDGEAELKSADGSGPSLVAVEEDGDPEYHFYWRISDEAGGSPGERPESVSNTVLTPTVTLEGDRIFIACLVPDGGFYGLLGTEDLQLAEWEFLSNLAQADVGGRLVFEVQVIHEIPKRFFQIRKVTNAP